jgi:hypothetical protein
MVVIATFQSIYHAGGDMKFRLWTIVSLLALLVVAACSSSTPAVSTEQPTSESQNPPVETAPAEAYPSPAEAVEATEAPQVAPGQSLYPEPQSGDEITWSQAVAMINNAEVNQVLKSPTLELTLNLKDGRSLLTNEPREGELQIVLDKCGDACTGIEVTGP